MAERSSSQIRKTRDWCNPNQGITELQMSTANFESDSITTEDHGMVGRAAIAPEGGRSRLILWYPLYFLEKGEQS